MSSNGSATINNGVFENTGGFAFGIGVSVGVIMLILIITLASYYCTHSYDAADHWHPPANSVTTAGETEDSVVLELGLDEETLNGYPKLLYSQVKMHKGESASTSGCCSICLGDYKDCDVLRLLPDCGHLFHLKCVDSWLRLNPTCPICRNSPLPTPQPTPLAEVAPLTGTGA